MDRHEPHVDVREGAHAAAKQRIGARAAAFVPDGASLVIDSGSTTLALCSTASG